MKFEPSTFFIGMIDFFSVMLPGATVTAALQCNLQSRIAGELFPSYSSEAGAWAMFLLASYVLGHFLFLIGAGLDELYDKIPKRWFTRDPKASLDRAKEIKLRYAPDIDGRVSINTFQWSKARFAIQHPVALAEVQRLEADSKFFRSFVIVLLVLPVIFWFGSVTADIRLAASVCCAFLAVLSFWRYCERRFKAIQQAYWYVVTLENLPPSPPAGGQA